jgi:hypothetical protein
MSNALSPVAAVLAKGKTLGEVLSALVKPKKVERPSKVALPAVLTTADKEAIDQLVRVFGSVCPQERTQLTPAQLTSIMAERLLVDKTAKLVTDRKEGIRTSVLNHIDIALEEDYQVDETTPLTEDGHYLLVGKHQVVAPDTHQVFSWEVSPSLPSINPDKLEALCHTEGSGLSHKDWLAMTFLPEVVTPPRRFSEDKAMAHLQAHPELLDHLEDAMDVGPPRGALYVRKEKA